jgi:hypothetical protein
MRLETRSERREIRYGSFVMFLELRDKNQEARTKMQESRANVQMSDNEKFPKFSGG